MEPHIFTIQKREKPYIIMDKGFLRKSNLTMQAKGLLAYLLTLSNDGEIHREELANSFKNGEKAIRKSLKELIEHGYICKEQTRDSLNHFAGVQYTIHEIPEIDKSIAEVAREAKAVAEEEAFQKALARGLAKWNSMNIEGKKAIFKKVHKQYSFIDANFAPASGEVSDTWLRDLIYHKLGKE